MKADTQRLSVAIISTRYGWIGLLFSDKGIKKLTLPCKSQSEVRKLLKAITGDAAKADESAIAVIRKQLDEYFQGKRIKFSCKLDLSGSTGFQHAVWKSAAEIPYGEIRSYQWIANRIGKAKAYRAVGQALARNPIPFIIPCHRVIYCGGKLGGFGGRANVRDFKRKLLLLEGAQSSNCELGAD